MRLLLCIIGLPIMGFHKNPNIRYFGVFLTTAGANSNIPAAMSYQANNIRGQWKRAFCSATLVGMGGVGGIAGSLVFRQQDSPNYHPGLYACIACCLLSLIIVAIQTVWFMRQNKRADRGEIELEADAVSRLERLFELPILTSCIGRRTKRFQIYPVELYVSIRQSVERMSGVVFEIIEGWRIGQYGVCFLDSVQANLM
jgi:MFS family permease